MCMVYPVTGAGTSFISASAVFSSHLIGAVGAAFSGLQTFGAALGLGFVAVVHCQGQSEAARHRSTTKWEQQQSHNQQHLNSDTEGRLESGVGVSLFFIECFT